MNKIVTFMKVISPMEDEPEMKLILFDSRNIDESHPKKNLFNDIPIS